MSSFVKSVFKRWELGNPINIPSIKARSSGYKTRLSSRPALPDSFPLSPGWSLKSGESTSEICNFCLTGVGEKRCSEFTQYILITMLTSSCILKLGFQCLFWQYFCINFYKPQFSNSVSKISIHIPNMQCWFQHLAENSELMHKLYHVLRLYEGELPFSIIAWTWMLQIILILLEFNYYTSGHDLCHLNADGHNSWRILL